LVNGRPTATGEDPMTKPSVISSKNQATYYRALVDYIRHTRLLESTMVKPKSPEQAKDAPFKYYDAYTIINSNAAAVAHLSKWYFTERDTAIPDDAVGDGDITDDIHKEFYYMFGFIRYLFTLRHPETRDMRITVEASWEDSTIVILHLKNRLLLDYNCSAWNFTWVDLEDFDHWVDGVLEDMEKNYKPTYHVVINNYGGVLNDIDIFNDLKKAEARFKQYAGITVGKYERLRKQGKDSLEIYGDEDTDVQFWDIEVED
jgi:hypothetical protein